MRSSRSSTCGILATAYIARQGEGGFLTSKEIARECGLGALVLVTILQQLGRHRVLIGESGRYGGFALAKPASETTLLEIVEAIDGPLRLHSVYLGSLRPPRHASRKLEAIQKDILERTRSRLRKVTIKQLTG